MTIIVNRCNAFVLTTFKIFRTFRKKISRSFVKILDKQKIFALISVSSVRRTQFESSILNFFEIVIFFDRFFEFATSSNFSSCFFVDLFFKIATFFNFSFFFNLFSNDFRDFLFLRRFREFVNYRFSNIFQEKFRVFFNSSINFRKKNVRHSSNLGKIRTRQREFLHFFQL